MLGTSWRWKQQAEGWTAQRCVRPRPLLRINLTQLSACETELDSRWPQFFLGGFAVLNHFGKANFASLVSKGY